MIYFKLIATNLHSTGLRYWGPSPFPTIPQLSLPSCTLYRVQVGHLEDAHLSIYPTCPSSGALALVLVKGQQAADALVGAGVVGVTRGVLGRLAVLSSEAQRADTGGAAGHGHTR